MTPQQFIAKWQRVTLTERSACQQHFLDLCELLDQPKPAEADPEGTWYTFEKGVQTSEDRQGWADVWMRDHFGWEYKGKHKDLKAAYTQLQLYREALENPPLMIVCDMDRFEVHTNFTGTLKQQHLFDLAGLADPANLDILRRVFTDPNSLKPGITSEAITIEAADRFAKLADGMRDRGIEPLRAAHFLMKLMFCMFGEDTLLLPAGLFGKLLDNAKANPAYLPRRLESLFKAMASGGDYGNDTIAWFNGGLFADADVISLTQEEINSLVVVNGKDWSCVEPSIFGTLFQRTLDPAKRSQIGAHFTGRADIEDLLKPVLLAPLQREWAEVKRKCEEELWPKVVKASRARTKGLSDKDSPQRKAFDRAILDFIERLAHVSVLDPACGSGNFLYVALHMLLDLEKEVIAYAAMRGLSLVPQVNPAQLRGLEINVYAQQLAQVVIWIGYLQWMHHNGFKMPNNPVLAPIDTIKQMDAILDLSDPEHPKEPEWPEAEFIVGNPPFLGGNRIRQGLGDDYVESLFRVYDGRVAPFADLCCYWFERARSILKLKGRGRVGLLATQSIRGGVNRDVLQRIKETGEIFFAESDREWVLDGATVHISMIGFDLRVETMRLLNGKPVLEINSSLTSKIDVSQAAKLSVNSAISYQGASPKAAFDIEESFALDQLQGFGVSGCPNSDVVRPVMSASDIVNERRKVWTIDFGLMELEEASLYETPFEYLRKTVYPVRSQNRRAAYAAKWWRYAEPRPGMRKAIYEFTRFIATPCHSKHRIFVFVRSEVLVNQASIVFAREDDYSFGVLQSRPHEVWARAQGTQLREVESGFRYTPGSCFDTFAFPEPDLSQSAAISYAAKDLDDRRSHWLNPPEWTKTEVLEFPGSVDGPWARYVV
ncbi:MAG: DNA methyltransferase, partial [Planctomycetota bacterium]